MGRISGIARLGLGLPRCAAEPGSEGPEGRAGTVTGRRLRRRDHSGGGDPRLLTNRAQNCTATRRPVGRTRKVPLARMNLAISEELLDDLRSAVPARRRAPVPPKAASVGTRSSLPRCSASRAARDGSSRGCGRRARAAPGGGRRRGADGGARWGPPEANHTREVCFWPFLDAPVLGAPNARLCGAASGGPGYGYGCREAAELVALASPDSPQCHGEHDDQGEGHAHLRLLALSAVTTSASVASCGGRELASEPVGHLLPGAAVLARATIARRAPVRVVVPPPIILVPLALVAYRATERRQRSES